jgi:group I intron endonuclease
MFKINMLSLGIIFLVMTIPLASLYLSTIFPSERFALLTTLYSILLVYNMLYFVPLFTSIEILGGLFQIILYQSNEMLLSFISSFQEGLLAAVVIVYSNAETDKSKNLTDTKDKTGIYQWIHIESNKRYVGSVVDLSKRLMYYYNKSFLNRDKNMYICNVIIYHTHSAFSLSILEYINIKNLSKDQARKLILSREQYYLDTLEPKYNILKVAENSLGYKHFERTLAKISKALTGENNPMYGKIGEKNPMFGRTPDTLVKMSEAKKGTNCSVETKTKISEALLKKVIHLRA